MRLFFYFTVLVYLFLVIRRLCITKQLITASNIVFVSTIVNFILYTCEWSEFFYVECSSYTYFFMAVVCALFSIYAILDKKKNDVFDIKLKRIIIGPFRIKFSTMILLCTFFLIAIENIYISGTLFTLDKISHHTANMPAIGTIVKGLYPVAYICAYIDYKEYKQKSILAFAFIVFAYSVLGLGSRFWATVSMLTTLFYVFSEKKISFSKQSIKKMVVISFALIGILNAFLYLGNLRMPVGLTYSDLIKYTGPFSDTILADVFAWYYGYFPYSFYNLNCTILNIEINDICTYGGFFMTPYIQFFHLQYFIESTYSQMTYSVRVFDNTAATVATGWFEFYSDFRYFFFIGIILFLVITYKFSKLENFFCKVSYSSMLTVWALMSFLNTYTVGVILYTFLGAYIVNRYFIVKEPYKKV